MNSATLMQSRYLLLAGIAIPLVFFSSGLILATLVEGYSHVSQTVSEIGESGSPAEVLWKLTSILVAVGFLVFARGIFQFAKARSASVWPDYFVGYFGLMAIGMAIFESPHPLHNLFGLSLTRVTS
jgi:hypothetical membrane protein